MVYILGSKQVGVLKKIKKTNFRWFHYIDQHILKNQQEMNTGIPLTIQFTDPSASDLHVTLAAFLFTGTPQQLKNALTNLAWCLDVLGRESRRTFTLTKKDTFTNSVTVTLHF